MLVLKERKSLTPMPIEIHAFTRKQLADAQSGRLSLTELEKMDLSCREVARFLVRNIPLMRAAAVAGKFDALGIFLEETYHALAARAETQIE
jgi:hypothetical protein